MQFVILRPVEIRDDTGKAITVPPTARRAVATLLMASERPVTDDDLMQAIWGDTIGREGALKTLMTQIRQLLSRNRVPQRLPSGYAVQLVPGDEVDVARFRDLVNQGSAAAQAGEHERAAELLDQAIRLWSAPPMPDVPRSPAWLDGLRDGLIFLYKAARVRLLQARLDLGENWALLDEIRLALADDPHSEHLHGLLMAALYRAGFRAEALLHYETAKTALVQTIGSGPGSHLQRLRDEIAADGQDQQTPGPAVLPASARPVPAQLPADVLDWTGREQEVEEMVSYLRRSADRVPIAQVHGPGGVGKSTLAVHVAHEVASDYPDGQLFAEVEGMSPRPRDISDVLGELIRALGVIELPRTLRERTALFRSLLAGRRVLVVIDDAAGAHHVTPLLPGSPGCAVIVTSRMQINGVAGAYQVRLYPWQYGESLELLTDMIGSARTKAEPEAAQAIVSACGGFPLAVRIAAARLSAHPEWSLAQYADQLSQRRLDMLSTEGMGVSATIGASYDHLPAEAQRAFRILSTLGPGDFPAWAAGLLLGDDAEALLDTLMTNSLISPSGRDILDQPRYRQHDLIREYGANRLAEVPADRDHARRMLTGWVELADMADAHLQLDPHYPPHGRLASRLYAPAAAAQLVEADPKRWFTAEINTLLALVHRSCEEGRFRFAMALALRINSYLFWRRRNWDAEDMWRTLTHAATAGGDVRLAAEARLRTAAMLTRRAGGAGRAMAMLGTCVEVFEQAQDRRGLARSLAARAFATWTHVRANREMPREQREELLRSTADDCRRGLAAAEEAEDRHGRMECLRSLGLVTASMGAAAEGIGLVEQSLAITRAISQETGHRAYEMYTLRLLILLHLGQGNYEEVLRLLDLGRPVMVSFDHASGVASWDELEGDALSGLGRHAEAAELYGNAARIYEGDVSPEHMARCLSKHASALIRMASTS
ncbi:BTAD domain-containing putative transcriptional regulator [Microbispora amethystogenes]|uniref:AfsR/SARP family transcriptional regulator n=1 Tax=Microbispora amethystogenes TaxID=1427754 RepID=UPI0033C1648D